MNSVSLWLHRSTSMHDGLSGSGLAVFALFLHLCLGCFLHVQKVSVAELSFLTDGSDAAAPQIILIPLCVLEINMAGTFLFSFAAALSCQVEDKSLPLCQTNSRKEI